MLYALLDAGLVAPEDFADEARRLAKGGVDVVQIRAKRLDGRAFLRAALGAMAPLRKRGIPVIINDRVDVARIVGADGVHLGADDVPPDAARRVLGPDRIIGVTAHDPWELREIGDEADYVGYGAVFATSTREDARICGPEALTAAAAGTRLPMIAIGGLRPENLDALRGAAIAGIAVGSAITPVHRRPGVLATLREMLDRW